MIATTLLIAALAAYWNLPRLYQLNHIGNTISAARVFDAVEHTRMAQSAANSGVVDTDLEDGRRSLDLISQVCPLVMVVSPALDGFRPPTLQNATPKFDTDYQPLVALGGMLFKLDLPPPRLEALWQPPKLQAPSLPGLSHIARGPPVKF
jgi:hypothetical protein